MLLHPEEKMISFDEQLWISLQQDIAISANLDSDEVEFLETSFVAKILCAIPYIAGCKNPEQIAVLEVSLYVAAIRNKKLFSHKENQTIRERINTGVLYPLMVDADPNVVEFGFTLLELISLNDHNNDLQADILTGYSNPLKDGKIIYFSTKQALINKLNSFDSKIYQSFQELLPSDIVEASWW